MQQRERLRVRRVVLPVPLHVRSKRIRVRVGVGNGPPIPSLLSIWIAIITLSKSITTITALRRHPSFFTSTTNRRILHHDDNEDNSYEYNQKAQSIIDSVKNKDNHNQPTLNSLRKLSPKPTDHLVTDLPYLNPNTLTTKHYAGHIPASHDDDKKLFYWLFEPDLDNASKHSDADIPLLIWLNGGPGCSSMDGLFLENGPIRLVRSQDDNNNNNNSNNNDHGDGWSIQVNPYSWHKAPAYVLYVDQPVGTGLSFTKRQKYCKNDLEVNIDFHLFLENFLIMYEDLFLNEIDQQQYDGGDNGFVQRMMKRPLYFSGYVFFFVYVCFEY